MTLNRDGIAILMLKVQRDRLRDLVGVLLSGDHIAPPLAEISRQVLKETSYELDR